MSAPAQTHEEKVLSSLLLVGVIVAGVAIVHEGPRFDNVIEGWNFFIIAFFAGALAGFLGWIRATGAAPALSFSAAHRNPWLAALVLGLAAAATASYLNRTFGAAGVRAVTAEIDAVSQGKGDRWHVTVKMPDGRYQRYLIPAETALALKNEQAVRMSIARGGLGFDYIASFEPARP